MQNDRHPPPLDPNLNKSQPQPVRNDQEQPQERERLWKHESEVPDASNESKGTTESGQRSGSN